MFKQLQISIIPPDPVPNRSRGRECGMSRRCTITAIIYRDVDPRNVKASIKLNHGAKGSSDAIPNELAYDIDIRVTRYLVRSRASAQAPIRTTKTTRT